MQSFLLRWKWSNRFLGILIKTCFRLNFFFPIVLLTKFFIDNHSTNKNKTRLNLLITGGERAITGYHINSLKTLLNNNGFNILILQEGWMHRILGCFLPAVSLSKSEIIIDLIFNRKSFPDKQNSIKMQRFFTCLGDALRIDALISFNITTACFLFNSLSQGSRLKSILFLESNFFVCPFIEKRWRESLKNSELHVDLVMTKNNISKEILSLSIDRNIIYVCGSVGKIHIVNRLIDNYDKNAEKRIMVFIRPFVFDDFMSSNPIKIRHYHEIFIDVIYKLASDHADWNFILCPFQGKRVSQYESERFDSHKLANIEYLCGDIYDSILSSRCILSSGNCPILMEAALAGRPVIIPLLGEVNTPPINSRLGKLCLLEEQCQYFLTPESEPAFLTAVEEVMQNPYLYKTPVDIGKRWVNDWITPIDSSADDKILHVLKENIV